MAGKTKSYKEYHRQMLFLEADRKNFFVELSKVVSHGETKKVQTLLDILKKEGHTRALAAYRENDGESMLHIAAKFNQDSEIIQNLIKVCPELLTSARKQSDDYFGQTALHIAIAKGNTDAVNTMLSETLNLSHNLRTALLHQLATGEKFANTIMMGELPLSVAALTFNEDMILILLNNGAEMERKNTKGDTVFHTLIRFAAIYPQFLQSVLNSLVFLNAQIQNKMDESRNNLSMECDHSDYTYIWFIPNNDELNALQMAASLSQPAIFEYILNLPKAYCFLNSHDGLFDSKLFDITEIDTVATEKWAQHQKERQNRFSRHAAPVSADGVSKHKFSNKATSSCLPFDSFRREGRKSVLEMMFDIKSSTAFEFIQQPTVRQVIKSKWLLYRWYYYIWMIFHIIFMSGLTVYSVLTTDQTFLETIPDTNGNGTVTTVQNGTQNLFLGAFMYVYLLTGILYFSHEVIHLTFRVKSFDLVQFFNVLHNGSYRVILSLFSVCLILEFVLDLSMDDYENYTLIIALITGWWFVIFFLRAQKKFSFFTVMIQKVIFGDMLRFSIIIVLALVSFTAGIYQTFKGSENSELHSYGSTMLLLFKLMLGLGDIEDLYDARRPWVAVTLFIAFVLLTYVLMFNALIAMMSQTCTMVSENRHVQWRVQQLSIILFFEGILPFCLKKMVGKEKHVKKFDPNTKQVISETRYFLDMSSIQTEYASAEDIYAMKQKLQTLPFGDQRTFYQDFGMTMNTQHFMMSPRVHYQRQGSYQRQSSIRSPKSDNQDNYIYPNTSINITPATNDNYNNGENANPPNLSCKKSKRDKSPPKTPKTPSGIQATFPDTDSGDNQAYQKINRPMRKKNKKKRVEPEGDNNIVNSSYDDHIPAPSRYNFVPEHQHLTVPNPVIQAIKMDVPERRRYNSENSGLVDTHIGDPQQRILIDPQQRFVVMDAPRSPMLRHVQMSQEQLSQMAAQRDGQGALDIGVISDSYM